MPDDLTATTPVLESDAPSDATPPEAPDTAAVDADALRKAENDRRAAEGRQRAAQERRERAEAQRRLETAEAKADAAEKRAAEIEAYLRKQAQAQEEATLAQMTEAEQARYWADRAQRIAAAQATPSPQQPPAAPSAADLLADANAHFGFEGDQVMTLEDFHPSAFKSVDAFVAAVNTLADTRRAAPSPEEAPVAKPPKDPDINKLVEQRVAEEVRKLMGATGASAPNAARPAATAPTGEVDYNAALYQAKGNRSGAAAVRAAIAAKRAEAGP